MNDSKQIFAEALRAGFNTDHSMSSWSLILDIVT